MKFGFLDRTLKKNQKILFRVQRFHHPMRNG